LVSYHIIKWCHNTEDRDLIWKDDLFVGQCNRLESVRDMVISRIVRT